MLDQLRADGVIDQAIVMSEQRGLVLKPANAPVYILDRALGVDPHTYPLAGTIVLNDGKSLVDTLQAGTLVLSQDVATSAGVGVGDVVAISSLGGSVPVGLRVAGIAERMPDRTGATAIYTIATADQIAGRGGVTMTALVTWGPRGASLETTACSDNGRLTGFAGTATERGICSDGWQFQFATTVSADVQRVVRVFDTMLKGAGLLGLLVGGIGVANTLQVLLARRLGEIAMLKTLGYQRRDVVLLVAIETALLGVAGSVVGVVVAIALSYVFLQLLSNAAGSLMTTWSIDVGALLGGALAGVVTAIIFGVAASLRATSVRPAALLRNHVVAPASTRAATGGLWMVLALLFAVLGSVILGSPLLGAGVLVFAVGGLLGLGGVLGGILVLIVRVRLQARGMVSLAQNNLRRQGIRSLFAVIALWAGVFAIGFAAAALLSGRDRVAGKAIDLGGDNVVVYAGPAAIANVEQQLQQHSVDQIHSQVLVQIDARHTDGTPLSIGQLAGRETLGSDLRIVEGAPWGTQQGVYIDTTQLDSTAEGSQAPLTVGDEITVIAANGERTLQIVGRFLYTGELNPGIRVSQPMLLTTDALVRTLGGAEVVAQVIGQAPPKQLRRTGTALNAALPDALVMTSADFNDSITRTFTSLFLFVSAIAALALVAGAVLIANAVALALVERRHEVGILKAVGYSSGHVLRTLMIEHSILGVVGGIAGVATVFAAIAVINWREEAARLALGPLPALGIVVVAVVLAITSALVVAWRPTHVRPLELLRDA